jgi:two-component system chemotaxis response regulator CheB
MIPKIKQFFRQPMETQPTALLKTTRCSAAPLIGQKSTAAQQGPMRPRVVVIGVSTGGPTALGEILPKIPLNFPLPILLVQHMPPLFTRLLAERLNSTCQVPVIEAYQGCKVEPGKVLIAPGDFHMKLVKAGAGISVCLDQTPRQNSCRPAVDALFVSAGEMYGGDVLAVILTGMGQDGLRGAEILKARGASVLAQDEASCIVWGMPGAVVNAGLADRVLPLNQVVPEILRRSAKNQEGAVWIPTR